MLTNSTTEAIAIGLTARNLLDSNEHVELSFSRDFTQCSIERLDFPKESAWKDYLLVWR
jgi:hypothetical protein